MNFKTHNETNVNAGGTSLQGYVSVSYHELLTKFGEPTGSDGFKSDAEWEILFDDGKVATIYNWKDGKNYNGSRGLRVERITDWHIGGSDKEVVSRVKELFFG
jgi:hypothetical protein